MPLTLYQLYHKMLAEMGPTGWWPAESKEQIIIESILIQNTTEANATKASRQLARRTAYDFNTIQELSQEQIRELIRPAGFMVNKAKSIQAVSKWYLDHDQNPQTILNQYGPKLRKTLLSLTGVGPETADVLLTYVFDQAQFVADKYARTLFGLLGITDLTNYQSLHRQISQLPAPFTYQDAQEFHGLIDEFGKAYFHPMSKFETSFLAGQKLIL